MHGPYDSMGRSLQWLLAQMFIVVALSNLFLYLFTRLYYKVFNNIINDACRIFALLFLVIIIIAICSTPCGINKECSLPENCTCQNGWKGNDCLIGMLIILSNYLINTIISIFRY